MAKSKVDILKEKIGKLDKEKMELQTELRTICKHKDIEYKNYCVDYLAQPKTYSDSFECRDCGLFGTALSPQLGKVSVSNSFRELYHAYWRKVSKFRVEHFDESYTVVK